MLVSKRLHLGRHPKDLVAIGLSDWPRFRSILVDTEASLRRLQVGLFLVAEDGPVELRLPLAATTELGASD